MAGVIGALSAGYLEGQVATQERVRKEQGDREKEALGMFRELTTQGWKQVNPKQGSRSGEALMFPSLGIMLEPPAVDKEAEYALKLDELRQKHNKAVMDYEIALKTFADNVLNREHKERTQSVEYKATEARLKSAELGVDAERERIKAIKARSAADAAKDARDAAKKGRIEGYTADGLLHTFEPLQGGGWMVDNDPKKLIPNLDSITPKPGGIPGVSGTLPKIDITIPDADGKPIKREVSPQLAKELVEKGQAIYGTPLKTSAEIPAQAPLELTQAVDKFSGYSSNEGFRSVRVISDAAVSALQGIAKRYDYEIYKIDLPKTSDDEAIRVIIPLPKGMKGTIPNSQLRQIVAQEMVNNYGYADEEDALRHIVGAVKSRKPIVDAPLLPPGPPLSSMPQS